MHGQWLSSTHNLRMKTSAAAGGTRASCSSIHCRQGSYSRSTAMSYVSWRWDRLRAEFCARCAATKSGPSRRLCSTEPSWLARQPISVAGSCLAPQRRLRRAPGAAARGSSTSADAALARTPTPSPGGVVPWRAASPLAFFKAEKTFLSSGMVALLANSSPGATDATANQAPRLPGRKHTVRTETRAVPIPGERITRPAAHK